MPFKSQEQKQLFKWKYPKLYKRFLKETPKGTKLPERVRKERAKSWNMLKRAGVTKLAEPRLNKFGIPILKKYPIKWKKTLEQEGVVRYHNPINMKYIEVTGNDGNWEIQLRKDNLKTGDVIMEKHLSFADNKAKALAFAKAYMKRRVK